MALTGVFKYRNLDSTADMNSRLYKLVKKGFFDGGDIVPVPLQLKIQIQPFRAMGYDGMTVFDNSSVQLDVVAGQLNYVVLRAVYRLNDTPLLQWQVMDSATYLGDAQLDYLLLRCIVNVPALATQVTTGMISTVQADLTDKLGRFAIRGHITSVSLLPTSNQRVGDGYIVTDGTGDQPSIFVWNGTTFVNVTTASVVANNLLLHRQNLFSNEIHLTDDQAEAVIGTFGTPDITNPFVTSQDPRVPTQDENDAMGGVPNTIYDPEVVLPDTTNRFITQSQQFSVGEEKVFITGTGGVVTIDASVDGPVWVGVGPDDISAFHYFNLFNSDINIDQEYINSLGNAPKITNIYVGNTPLVPNSTQTYPPLGTQPSGFLYSGLVHLVLDGSLFRTFNDTNVNVGTDEITLPGHLLTNNRRVRVSTVGTLPTPLLPNTDYYVIPTNANTIQLSATPGPGSPVNLTSTGAGQFVIYDAVGTDTSFRLSYGKQYNLANIPPDAMMRRKPSDAQKDSDIGISTKLQEFSIVVATDTINLNNLVFEMYPFDNIVDVNVYENGVKLMPNDGYFKPIVIQTGVNDKIDIIDSTLVPVSITLPAGTYSTASQLQNLALQIQTLLDTASADSITCTYNAITFKFSINDVTGNYQLLWATGPNYETNCATELGFNRTDLSGSNSYSSQNMIDRGYVGWYKVTATQLKLVRPAQPNGNITVEKSIAFNF